MARHCLLLVMGVRNLQDQLVVAPGLRAHAAYHQAIGLVAGIQTLAKLLVEPGDSPIFHGVPAHRRAELVGPCALMLALARAIVPAIEVLDRHWAHLSKPQEDELVRILRMQISLLQNMVEVLDARIGMAQSAHGAGHAAR